MDDRYHLTLALDGRPAMHGWWAEETAARGQIRVWVRNWGVSGARITLVDEDEGLVIHSWPDES